MIAVGGASAAILFGPEIIGIAFGVGYSGSIPILAVLACGVPAMAFIMQNHLIQIETNARFTRNCAVAGVFFLFLSAVMLTDRFGAEGAALSRVGTMALMVLANVVFLGFIGASAALPKFHAALFAVLPGALVILNLQAQSLAIRALAFTIVVALALGMMFSVRLAVKRK